MRTKADVSADILRLVSAEDAVTSRGGTVTRVPSDRVNEALGLGLAGTKHTLPQQIVERAGLVWDDACWSRGGTVTLYGLERLLEATRLLLDDQAADAERAATEAASRAVMHAAVEPIGGTDRALCGSVADVVASALPALVDGRQAVTQLREWGNQWRQIEWIGFWCEHVAREAVRHQLGGSVGPKFGNTEFDLRLGRVFDIKSHAHRPDDNGAPVCPLNDVEATDAAVLQTGAIGFVVIRGHATYDDDEHTFYAWHRTSQGKPVEPRTPTSRLRKTAFAPYAVDVVLLRGLDGLRTARDVGLLRVMNQGRQQSGATRRPKYMLDLGAARPSNVLHLTAAVPGSATMPPTAAPTLFGDEA